MFALNGTGVTFYGRGDVVTYKNALTNSAGVMVNGEEVTVTKWLTLLWLPVLPLGRYRIFREERADMISRLARHVWVSERIRVLRKLPLSWRNVAKVYLFIYTPVVLLFAL